MAQPLSRRDRVRAATVTEIKDTARRILVAEGVDGLSLRAIARDMGMTAAEGTRRRPRQSISSPAADQ